ncbi:cytochrome P450 1A1-like [Mercenaria mercenaria]|uniref:cytochrome P450 1A1-like n=1 Tax=Mercenaria mercenaria TaxID=6596 RepID=UPI00234E9A24|nr:cytochrome P450 1A1-like [Mercenaria mercenaria]
MLFIHSCTLYAIFARNIQRILTAREKIHEKYMYRIKETREKDKVRGYVDFLLNEQDRQLETGNEVFLTDETINAMLQELVIAGFITTFSTLSNLFLCLMNHPNYQRKAQKELNRVVGNERLPTIDDIYRSACYGNPKIQYHLVDIMRLEEVCNLKDFKYQPTVLANLWFIHHDERIWGDPWTFRPERFLNDKGQLLEREHVFWKSLIPFGVGRRQCIGEPFARSRIFLYTASLLQEWTFVPSPGKVGTCDRRKGDFKINALIRKESLFCTVEDAETGG